MRHTNGIDIINIYSNDALLSKAFSWLARIGAGPKFGSRPIGWYQMHMCSALDSLRATGGIRARVRNGTIEVLITNNGWQKHVSPSALFTIADTASRK